MESVYVRVLECTTSLGGSQIPDTSSGETYYRDPRSDVAGLEAHQISPVRLVPTSQATGRLRVAQVPDYDDCCTTTPRRNPERARVNTQVRGVPRRWGHCRSGPTGSIQKVLECYQVQASCRRVHLESMTPEHYQRTRTLRCSEYQCHYWPSRICSKNVLSILDDGRGAHTRSYLIPCDKTGAI